MDNNTGLTSAFIERYWPLSRVHIGELLQKSDERTVGLIHSTEGTFVYKIAPERWGISGVTKNTAVFDALYKKGFRHAPRLLKTRSSADFSALGTARFAYLLEYVVGVNPPQSVGTYERLGEITAELHEINDFPFKTDFDTRIIINDLRKNSEQYVFGSEYKKVLEALPDFQELPKTVIHTDIAPINSIQKDNGEIVLVDWDDAGIGPSVLDLGSLLNEVIDEDLNFRAEHAKVFYQSYFSKRTTSQNEIAHIVDAALFFACMYIVHGDREKRWQRIQWMIEGRKTIEDAVGIANIKRFD